MSARHFKWEYKWVNAVSDIYLSRFHCEVNECFCFLLIELLAVNVIHFNCQKEQFLQTEISTRVSSSAWLLDTVSNNKLLVSSTLNSKTWLAVLWMGALKLRLVQCLLPGVFIYTVQPALRFAVPDQAAVGLVTCILGCSPCGRICVCCLQQPGQAALKAFFWVFCPEKQSSALGWWELNLLNSFWWSCHRALECYSHILSGVIHRWPFLEVRKLFQGGN